MTVKLNGMQELIESNPRGFEDAVNGSHYRDGGDASERFIRSLGRYVNELERRLEAE